MSTGRELVARVVNNLRGVEVRQNAHQATSEGAEGGGGGEEEKERERGRERGGGVARRVKRKERRMGKDGG